ncbi:group 1 truncated hemoglobin [Spongiibacter sp.]|uniref:group I truncated hemoglobin n=1 Tax=Spongiibacter sp. TaxID=2024860 RepID=UPI0035654B9D
MATLYERIGGEAAVDKAVDIFYEKVTADERISSFFANIDMFAQARKQKAFLTMVFGGPANYSGQDMRTAHAGMGLTDEHFDAVLEDLAATLAELGVGSGDIQEVAGIAQSVRGEVLGR